MKKFSLAGAVLAVVAAMLVFTAGAFAAEEKIGAIEPQKILFQHPKYEQTMKQIQTLADQKLEKAQEQIDKENDEEKKRQIFQTTRREIAEEEQKLMRPLFDEIDRAVRTVAASKQITVVVDKEAVFFGTVDITDDVVQELRKASASGK